MTLAIMSTAFFMSGNLKMRVRWLRFQQRQILTVAVLKETL